MLCRCASPGGESSACIARAWSRVSRVPVGAGAQVPSPCLAATAAQTHLCCQAPTCHTNDAWRPTRAGATADRRQKQLQRGAGISAVHQRGAAVQQHAGAGGRTLCLLVVCAMTAERIGDLLFNRRPPNESWAKDFRSARLVCAAAWSLAIVRRFLRAQVDAAMQRRRLPFGARPLVATGEGLNASPLTALRFGDTLPRWFCTAWRGDIHMHRVGGWGKSFPGFLTPVLS